MNYWSTIGDRTPDLPHLVHRRPVRRQPECGEDHHLTAGALGAHVGNLQGEVLLLH